MEEGLFPLKGLQSERLTAKEAERRMQTFREIAATIALTLSKEEERVLVQVGELEKARAQAIISANIHGDRLGPVDKEAHIFSPDDYAPDLVSEAEKLSPVS